MTAALELWSPGYVYLWYDVSNGMMYVGSHNGLNSRYIGSGKRFRSAYEKRPASFKRVVLYVGPYFREVEEVLLAAVDAEANPLYYNLMNTAGDAGSRALYAARADGRIDPADTLRATVLALRDSGYFKTEKWKQHAREAGRRGQESPNRLRGATFGVCSCGKQAVVTYLTNHHVKTQGHRILATFGQLDTGCEVRRTTVPHSLPVVNGRCTVHS